MQNEMTNQRANEIALKLVQYRSSRRGINLNPSTEGEYAIGFSKRYGLNINDSRSFNLQVILPQTIGRALGVNGKLRFEITTEPPFKWWLSDEDLYSIALKIIQIDGIDINRKSFNAKIKLYAERTGVNEDEMRQFYLQYVIPHVVAVLTK